MFDPLMIVVATQIIIESLPISSSGHMMLAHNVLARWGCVAPQAVPDALNDMLHLPTLLIVLIYFFREWSGLLRLFVRALPQLMMCRFAQLPDSNKRLLRIVAKIIGMVVVADSVTVCWYVLLKLLAKQGVVIECLPALACGFVVTGALLLGDYVCARFLRDTRPGASLLRTSARKIFSRVSFQDRNQQGSGSFCARPEEPIGRLEGFVRNITIPLLIGFIQGIALLPGISRFASTVMVGRMCGLSMRRSLQFSFLMFMPLMCAALVGNALPALLFDQTCRKFIQPAWLVVYAISSLVAYALFVGACRLVLSGRAWWFGVYMLVPIIVSLRLMF